MPTVSRPRIGWGKFILLALVYLGFTVLVIAILFRDYQVSSLFNIRIFGTMVPELVYIAGLAFIGFFIQHKLSAAYGAGRFADIVVSLPMLIAVALAFLMWARFPIVSSLLVWISALVGYPFVATPSETKIGAALIFAFFALIDFARDWLGIGRRSSFRFGGRTPIDIPDGGGDIGDPPGAPTGSPPYRVPGDAILDLRWWIRNPVTGEIIPLRNVPPSLATRVIDHIVRVPPADPPRPADPPPTPPTPPTA